MSRHPTFAELISGAAHELRSPLTSVKGFSSTLVKRWDRFSDHERLEFVGAINTDAERMARIVSEVIDLARLDAGTLGLQRGPVRLAALVKDILERLASSPGADRVVVDVPEGLVAWTDEDRFERDLANLIENAMKFSQEGPITVTARALQHDRVEISVGDHGVGIAEDRLPLVLSEPAPRGQIATPKGTGLGLYLARRLLEAQGGSISVTSKLNAGSTFTIQLPAREPDE